MDDARIVFGAGHSDGMTGLDAITMRLRSLGGVARRGDLVRTGQDGKWLALAVEAGHVVRPARGTYALPGAEPALVVAAVYRARLGCVSAVEFLRLPVLDPPTVPHLSVPRTRGANGSRTQRARVHRESGLSATGPAVPLPQALARMLLCQGVDQAVVSIDAAVQRGIVTVGDVRGALPTTAPAHAAAALTLVDGRSQSPIETVARLALARAGFQPEPAVLISGVGYVDLVVDGRVVIELDGFAYHSGRREYGEDRRRDRELVAQGYAVLRFTYEDVMRDVGVVVRAVRAALAAGSRSAPHL